MMKRNLFCILWVLFISSTLSGQEKKEFITGQVSFVTSNNVYVKFKSTEHIKIGDTLLISAGAAISPCLKVTQKSSTSSVCILLNGCEVKKGDQILFNYLIKEEVKKDEKEPEKSILIVNETATTATTPESKSLYKENIRGRISAASYSSLSPQRKNRHRMMYRFSLNAEHLGNSKFSVESYINYRQNFVQNDEAVDRKTKFFKVYNLALRYDVDTTLSLVVGRKINNKVSSLGAIDGLQAEKFFGKFYTGIIAGFRPDVYTYNINPDLFQYGAYIGKTTDSKRIYSQSTLGLLEQRNAGSIDRRYTYFQHSSTINRKLNLFVSLELDLYKKINGILTTDTRLTNFYASARYRVNRKVNFTVSYDSRKRIFYYETLKTEIERLLDDDDARQGIRIRANVKPFKYIHIGVSYSKRFQNNKQNKSDNINGNISLSRIPTIGGRLSVNFNMNTSNYLESQILSFRHSRSLIKKKLNGDFYVRLIKYTYINSGATNEQVYLGTNLSYRINRKLVFSILGELAAKSVENTYRINARIIKRFDNKGR